MNSSPVMKSNGIAVEESAAHSRKSVVKFSIVIILAIQRARRFFSNLIGFFDVIYP